MDLFDAIASVFSPPSRGRKQTPQEKNIRGVAIYVLPTILFFAVIAGVPDFVTLGVSPLLVLGVIDAVGPRFGLDGGRSRRLAFQSAWVCLAVASLGHFLKQSLIG